MALTKGSIILDSDIDSIITSINNESSRRSGTGGSGLAATVTKPVQKSKALANLATAMVSALANINAAPAHYYSEASIHNGGVIESLLTTGFTFTSGSTEMYSSTPPDITDIQTDIATLAAQTECNNTTSSCACNTQCCNSQACCNTQCCNGNTCSCNYNGYCGQACCNNQCACNTNCSCNEVCSNTACSCNTVCSCEYV